MRLSRSHCHGSVPVFVSATILLFAQLGWGDYALQLDYSTLSVWVEWNDKHFAELFELLGTPDFLREQR